MITDSNPNSSMMNMIPTIQTEESKLPENQELLKQELLKKLLTNIAMSQKKIYKDQLTFQTRTKKILTQDFLKMNQNKLQNSTKAHSKATLSIIMVKKNYHHQETLQRQ